MLVWGAKHPFYISVPTLKHGFSALVVTNGSFSLRTGLLLLAFVIASFVGSFQVEDCTVFVELVGQAQFVCCIVMG